MAKNMVHAWNDGIEAMRSPKPDIARSGLADAIEEAHFSGPDKPLPDEKFGQSPMLPKRGGRAF